MSSYKPNIDELEPLVDSRFTLVVAAAKRARQINQYFNSLKTLAKCDYEPPKVEASETDKPLAIAFEEIRQGKVRIKKPSAQKAAEKSG